MHSFEFIDKSLHQGLISYLPDRKIWKTANQKDPQTVYVIHCGLLNKALIHVHINV